MSLLKNRVALIIGGASEMGFEYAKMLIKSGVGGIMIADVNKKKGEEVACKLGAAGKVEVEFIKTDVSVPVQLQYAFEGTVDRFQRLDIAINSILQESSPEKTIRVNFIGVLRGTYMAMMEYLPKYKCTEEGILINTISLSGLLPQLSCPSYTTSNHALVALGRSLGTDYYYKKYRTRVLTICPDVTELSMFRREDMEGMDGIILDQKIKSQTSGLSLMKVIESGTNGSVWVSGCNDIYEVPFPDRFEVRRKMKREEFIHESTYELGSLDVK